MQNKNLINNKEKSTQSDSVKKGISSLFEWVETVIFAFCFVVFLFTFVFKIVTVSGPSMNYTLYNGQKLVISSMFYSPQRGDIVVVDTPKFNEPIIKRIIALEGVASSTTSPRRPRNSAPSFRARALARASSRPRCAAARRALL